MQEWLLHVRCFTGIRRAGAELHTERFSTTEAFLSVTLARNAFRHASAKRSSIAERLLRAIAWREFWLANMRLHARCFTGIRRASAELQIVRSGISGAYLATVCAWTFAMPKAMRATSGRATHNENHRLCQRSRAMA